MSANNMDDWGQDKDPGSVLIYVGMVVFVVCLGLFGKLENHGMTTPIDDDVEYALAHQ